MSTRADCVACGHDMAKHDVPDCRECSNAGTVCQLLEDLRTVALDPDQNFCGCCGNEIGRSTRSDPLWCNRCGRHVRRSYNGYQRWEIWERTYQARTGVPCPFQVGIGTSSTADNGGAS